MMFTGIIETVGKLIAIKTEGSSLHFEIESSISKSLKIDQSVSHNGVCLTVIDVKGTKHKVTAIEETLQRTNLGILRPGMPINLERSLPANGRFDGHIVQGHIDGTALCSSISENHGSWIFQFESEKFNSNLVVEKGSIGINGISLTCFDVGVSSFSLAVIPYTYENTNLNILKKGDQVNIEYDILGKYVSKILSSG